MSVDVAALLNELICGEDDRAEHALKELVIIGEKAIPFIEPLLSSPQVDARWWALHTLSKFTNPPRALILKSLTDENSTVRQCAALGLCYHPHVENIPPLIEALNDSDSLMVELSANALIAAGKDSTSALMDAYEKSKPATRVEIIRALAILKDHRAIPIFMKAREQNSALLNYWSEKALNDLGFGMLYFKPE